MNKYIERVEYYDERGNQTGIYYTYAVIFRRIFIFDKPEDPDVVLLLGTPNLAKRNGILLPEGTVDPFKSSPF